MKYKPVFFFRIINTVLVLSLISRWLVLMRREEGLGHEVVLKWLSLTVVLSPISIMLFECVGRSLRPILVSFSRSQSLSLSLSVCRLKALLSFSRRG